MPKITIDGRSIDVAPGTKVIAAAEQLGIFVPRLCYHPALGSVGACRLCAVSFLDGPVRGLQMSCMVEAQDGMVVSTTAPEAAEFRRQVIEWLMANHPHDCPVCDEGGHCLLQEVTVGSGHGLRRHTGKKRTYRDQDLGPHVQQEMNRCIHCYRCRRFYQDVAGGRDLGALGNAGRTTFGRFASGPLESPFSGNLVDLCPTGVFTDKGSRFKGRRWDFQRAPSICLECSLGCSTTVSARYREVIRIEARHCEAVNGHFLCDRGRYGFGHANAPERPRRPLVDGTPTGLGEALDAAAAILFGLPPMSVACLGSTRSSLETQTALLRLCQRAGWRVPSFFLREEERQKHLAAVAGLSPEISVSLRQVEDADFALVVGADPLNEAPMLALALRQAVRKGAAVVVLDSREVSLPFPFERLPTPPDELDTRLEAFVHRSLGPLSAADPLAARLAKCRNPVLVCGTDLVPATTPGAAARAAEALRAAKGRAGLFYVLAAPNAFGAASLAPEAPSLEGLLPAIEEGELRVLVVCENDPLPLGRATPRMAGALRKLRLIVLDDRATATVHIAGVFLPTRNVFEAGGTYVNQEGRHQVAIAVHGGGASLALTGNGGHPPREFRTSVPEGEARPARDVLHALDGHLAGKRPAEG